ncbi:MAG TPA: hypothetical protein VLJ16_02910 [Acidobacteriota bacterium]|nr:hypothetical protein [Acidobacteriota bacterium]
MITKRTLVRRATWAPSLAAVMLLAGCAARTEPPDVTGAPAAAVAKAPAVPAAPAGIVLEYKMPEGRTLSYQTTGEVVESAEIMGQTRESHSTSSDAFSLRGKGRKGQDLLLNVTIDDMSMVITAPQGDVSPNLTSLRGKSFDMVLSPLGSEVDVSAAQAITYEAPSGPRSIAAGFKLFFPVLPGKVLRIGDSWPSGGGTTEKTGGIEVKLEFQNVNTFEGLETIDGRDCARIRSEVTGSISGSGNQQGMDMVFSGTGKGTDLWYFAVKEGVYIKSTSDMKMDISITLSALGQTLPTTQTRKSEVKLVGMK